MTSSSDAPQPTAQRARDYNRSLPPPVRWVHMTLAGMGEVFDPIGSWIAVRKHWAIPLIIACAAVLLGPLFYEGAVDLWLGNLLRFGVSGDLRRELDALAQWGALSSLVLTIFIIWRMDPKRRLRLADLLAALIVLFCVVMVMKLLLGRPRPTFGIVGPDGVMIEYPGEILWPWGAWPIQGAGIHYAWEFWAPAVADGEIWSMPSSHTAFAVALSVFVGMVYPRLRILAIALATIVAWSGVNGAAHYPSDVIVGACAGYAVAHGAIAHRWGRRLLSAMQRRLG